MMRVYFESSAFAKRYIDETGTADVLAWREWASELALSVINLGTSSAHRGGTYAVFLFNAGYFCTLFNIRRKEGAKIPAKSVW